MYVHMLQRVHTEREKPKNRGILCHLGGICWKKHTNRTEFRKRHVQVFTHSVDRQPSRGRSCIHSCILAKHTILYVQTPSLTTPSPHISQRTKLMHNNSAGALLSLFSLSLCRARQILSMHKKKKKIAGDLILHTRNAALIIERVTFI